MPRILLALAMLPSIVSAVWAADAAGNPSAGFALKDNPGQYLDVLLDGRIAARYMYAHDTSTSARRGETYKPYLHVFDADGKAPITKGPGGLYTHHRGIFLGWTRLGFQGKSYDFWGMGGGEIVHQKFARQDAGADQATFTSLTRWITKSGETAVEEERATTIRRGTKPFRLVIDCVFTLKAPNGDVLLDGDPEHAGIQYRPAAEVTTSETLYVFPKEKAQPHKDLDYPWLGETYTLGGKQHSVVQLNHPANPKGTRFSAYRDYGRFGAAFLKHPIKSGESLTVKYGFLVADGEMPPAAAIQQARDKYAGSAQPTPVPKTTVLPAEGAAKPKKAKPDRPAAKAEKGK